MKICKTHLKLLLALIVILSACSVYSKDNEVDKLISEMEAKTKTSQKKPQESLDKFLQDTSSENSNNKIKGKQSSPEIDPRKIPIISEGKYLFFVNKKGLSENEFKLLFPWDFKGYQEFIYNLFSPGEDLAGAQKQDLSEIVAKETAFLMTYLEVRLEGLGEQTHRFIQSDQGNYKDLNYSTLSKLLIKSSRTYNDASYMEILATLIQERLWLQAMKNHSREKYLFQNFITHLKNELHMNILHEKNRSPEVIWKKALELNSIDTSRSDLLNKWWNLRLKKQSYIKFKDEKSSLCGGAL